MSLKRIESLIVSYYLEHGIPPTRREVMIAMGYKTPRSVDYFMEKPEAEGMFRKYRGHYFPIGYKVVKS